MKLDWQVIKTLLAKFEDETIQEFVGEAGKLPAEARIENFETRERLKKEAREQERLVFGHLRLCIEGEWIDGLSVWTNGGFEYSYDFRSPRLTLRGHELLGNLRSPIVWARVKSATSALGVPITAETISVLAAKVIKDL